MVVGHHKKSIKLEQIQLKPQNVPYIIQTEIAIYDQFSYHDWVDRVGQMITKPDVIDRRILGEGLLRSHTSLPGRIPQLLLLLAL